jgi:hypothetical protein
MIVVFKAYVEHSVLLALGHAIEFALIEVSQTDVFHCPSPRSSRRFFSSSVGAGSTAVADVAVTDSNNEAQHILI